MVDGSTTVYDITYEYDELGNQMEKLDDVADIKTCYVYDTNWDAVSEKWDSGLCFEPDDPEYDTRNNRLLEYREYEDDGQSGWDELRRVRYVYYETGHVANITIKDVDDDWYRDLALFYTSDGKLWRALWDEWKVSGEQITNYGTIKAREFYYDGPRQRYLSREVDPDTWEPTDDPQLWTDYNGPSPYGDFELTFDQGDPVTDESMRYLAGSGIQAQQTLDGGQPDETSYLHGDLIDSTMLTTDEGGTAVSAVSYTAFGEPVGDLDALGTRYQYAGGWGYESGLLTLGGANPALSPVTLQHVGWRWYQPDTGRFIQRDPIDLGAGLNVYAYVSNNPIGHVDPSGLTLMDPPERVPTPSGTRWRDPVTGRWVKTPWWAKQIGKWTWTNILALLQSGITLGELINWGASGEYQSFYWVVGDTGYWCVVVVRRNVENSVYGGRPRGGSSGDSSGGGSSGGSSSGHG